MPDDPERFHKVHYVTVSGEHAGQRIDNFLIGLLKTIPRSLVYRLLRTGQVRVNKGRVKPARKLCDGDVIRVPPVTFADEKSLHLPASLLQQIEKSVLHECSNWIVVNKPHGLAVHGGSGVKFGVIDLLQKVFDDDRISLVHRLDRDTSGCLVLAKNRLAAVHFQDALKNSRVRKHYVALLSGSISDACRVDVPLAKTGDPDTGVRMVQVDRQRGKPALSLLQPRQTGTNCSLVDIEIKTGRTHQIRVHTTFLGHPVIGDDRYGDRTVNRWASSQGLKRMCLHAATVEFPDCPAPIATEDGKICRFSCLEDSRWLTLSQST